MAEEKEPELDNFDFLQEVLVAHPLELTLTYINPKAGEWLVRYTGPREEHGRVWIETHFGVMSRLIKDWYKETDPKEKS